MNSLGCSFYLVGLGFEVKVCLLKFRYYRKGKNEVSTREVLPLFHEKIYSTLTVHGY